MNTVVHNTVTFNYYYYFSSLRVGVVDVVMPKLDVQCLLNNYFIIQHDTTATNCFVSIKMVYLIHMKIKK